MNAGGERRRLLRTAAVLAAASAGGAMGYLAGTRTEKKGSPRTPEEITRDIFNEYSTALIERSNGKAFIDKIKLITDYNSGIQIDTGDILTRLNSRLGDNAPCNPFFMSIIPLLQSPNTGTCSTSTNIESIVVPHNPLTTRFEVITNEIAKNNKVLQIQWLGVTNRFVDGIEPWRIENRLNYHLNYIDGTSEIRTDHFPSIFFLNDFSLNDLIIK